MFFYLEGLATFFLFFEGVATYLFSIWEGMASAFLLGGAGHLLIFYLGGVATYLFSIWGWPSSLLGRGAGH